MAAIIYPLEADEGRAFTLGFVWRDSANNRVEVEEMGAILEVRTNDGELISKITHTDNILLGANDGEETTEEESTQGDITFTIPAEDLKSPKSYDCQYELIVFDDANAPRDNPSALLRGGFKIRKQVVNLD